VVAVSSFDFMSMISESVSRYQLGYRQTRAGFWRVVFADHPARPSVTLSPAAFAEILPAAHRGRVTGRLEVDADTVIALGFDIESEVLAV
jgi:hypothetical protein